MTHNPSVKRPRFSALDCSKIINEFEINIKPWSESLNEFLIKYIK